MTFSIINRSINSIFNFSEYGINLPIVSKMCRIFGTGWGLYFQWQQLYRGKGFLLLSWLGRYAIDFKKKATFCKCSIEVQHWVKVKTFLVIIPWYLLGSLPLVLSVGTTITLTQDPTCALDSSLSGSIYDIDSLLSLTMTLFQMLSLHHWTSQS